ncbi:YceI family protein [uncultured Winogradskyella sp.]|uniref:YceI family protein n=1 Tax=uncultured Winogradskyella sp. TaxID=395353 RepID=UPI00263083D8|nr:YceI family protein [uncultured Winogradskyella sp.]
MKTKHLKTFILIGLISIAAFSQNKTVNKNESTISWTGKAAFNAYSLTGTLKVKSGNASIENDSIKSLNIIIDMKSLDHENGDLKKHLRGKDFFEVKTYTEATFTVSQPFQIKNGSAEVTGQLKIKDVIRTETFIVNLNDDYSMLSFDISVDRTKYGVKFNSPSFFKKMKENAIADEFKLKGNLKLD